MATRCCVSRVVGQPPLCPADPAPQSEPLPGMVPNSAGGHSYPVDDMTRLQRFLILGSEGGSYYANERKLTLENAAAVKRCIENDGPKAVYEIAYISRHGRAPKVGPPLFALAMAATYGHLGTRALAFGYLSQMARTGSQLQMFIDYIGTMRGWGRSLRRAVGKWSTDKDIEDAVYQTVKYHQRYNWTHRDLLRKAHPKVGSGALNDCFAWITHGTMPPDDSNFALIHAYEQAKRAAPGKPPLPGLSGRCSNNSVFWRRVTWSRQTGRTWWASTPCAPPAASRKAGSLPDAGQGIGGECVGLFGRWSLIAPALEDLDPFFGGRRKKLPRPQPPQTLQLLHAVPPFPITSSTILGTPNGRSLLKNAASEPPTRLPCS